MQRATKWIALLLILLVLSGCKATPPSEDLAGSDPLEQGTANEEPKQEENTNPTSDEKTKISLMSLNIRHSQEVEPNTKEKRLTRMGQLFAHYRPAVIGLQKVRPWWMNHMEDTAPGLPDVVPEGYESICYYRNEKRWKWMKHCL